jgi:hypothetical protein
LLKRDKFNFRRASGGGTKLREKGKGAFYNNLYRETVAGKGDGD